VTFSKREIRAEFRPPGSVCASDFSCVFAMSI